MLVLLPCICRERPCQSAYQKRPGHMTASPLCPTLTVNAKNHSDTVKTIYQIKTHEGLLFRVLPRVLRGLGSLPSLAGLRARHLWRS